MSDPTPSSSRNLVAIWPSMFAVSLGLMAVIPTLGLFLEEQFQLQGDELKSWTGWIYAAAPLTAACIGPLWGAIGDRIGRKSMVIRASLAIAISTALMPLAATPTMLLWLRVMQGAFAGFIAPAMALGTANVAPGQQGRYIGRMQLALALGLLCGPVIAAQIAPRFGRASVFYFTAIVSFLSALPVIFFVREDRSELRQPKGGRGVRNLTRNFATDLYALLGNPVFLALLTCIFLLRFGQHMVEPFIALWIRELGPLPWVAAVVDKPEVALEQTIAAAFVVLAVAQILLTTRWGRLADRIGPMRCLAVVGLGLGGVFFVTAMTRSITAYFFLRSAAAVFMAGGMTLAYAAVAKRVPKESKSLAFTLVQSGLQFGLSLGPVVGEAMAGDHGLPGLYVIGGASLTLAGLSLWLLRSR